MSGKAGCLCCWITAWGDGHIPGWALQPLLPVPSVGSEPRASLQSPAAHGNQVTPQGHPTQPALPALVPKNKPSKDGRGVRARGPAPGTGAGRVCPTPSSSAAWVLRGSLQDRDQRGDGEDGPSLSHGSSGPRRDVPGDKRAAGIN